MAFLQMEINGFDIYVGRQLNFPNSKILAKQMYLQLTTAYFAIFSSKGWRGWVVGMSVMTPELQQ